MPGCSSSRRAQTRRTPVVRAMPRMSRCRVPVVRTRAARGVYGGCLVAHVRRAGAALLHLGVKNIRLGPALPAFVSPSVLGVLVDKFGIKAIGEVEEDLEDMLSRPAA